MTWPSATTASCKPLPDCEKRSARGHTANPARLAAQHPAAGLRQPRRSPGVCAICIGRLTRRCQILRTRLAYTVSSSLSALGKMHWHCSGSALVDLQPPPSTTPQLKLLGRVRDAIRTRRYSGRTEAAYVAWTRRYIGFHQKAHPSTLGAAEISAFLTWLATARHVSASARIRRSRCCCSCKSTCSRCRWVRSNTSCANQPLRLHVVLSRGEVAAVLSHVDGVMWIIGMLLYGSGLRLEECLELRAKDIDVDRSQITARRGKGQIAAAVRRSGITKHVGPHTMGHCFGTHLLEGRLRHSDGAATARSLGRQHDHDLYPRAQSWGSGREEPGGPADGSAAPDVAASRATHLPPS